MNRDTDAYRYVIGEFAQARWRELQAAGYRGYDLEARAYRESHADAERWYRRHVMTTLPPVVLGVHVVLSVATVGAWLPIFLTHLWFVNCARNMRWGVTRRRHR